MVAQSQQSPLLSVTVLNYNYGHFLPNCLDSILSQSFKDFEVILINDTSTDNSIEVIQPYLADPRVRLIDHEENKGFVASLIEGTELSRGKYITVISADDWIVDMAAFEKQTAVMEQDSEIAFVYSAYGHFQDEHSAPSHVWRSAHGSYVRDSNTAFVEMVLNPYVLHSGTIIRMTAYRATGGYNTSLHYAVDTDIFLNLCHVGKAAYIDEMLYGYRRHMTSMSKTSVSIKRTLEEVLQVIDQSFVKCPIADREQLRSLRSHAEQKALIAYAADEVFRSCYHEGWRGFRVAVQLRPIQTICQKMTVIVAARALLGETGFNQLRRITSVGNSRRREETTARHVAQQTSQ